MDIWFGLLLRFFVIEIYELAHFTKEQNKKTKNKTAIMAY